MIETVVENILIIAMTVAALFTTDNPAVLIICAGVTMVLVTYGSLMDEKNYLLTAATALVMCAFAMLSGSFVGFIAFALLKDIKPVFRAGIGIVLYAACSLLLFKERTAICVLFVLILIVVYAAILFAYAMMEKAQQRRDMEMEKIVASNVSALHEKRINEELVKQNLLTEKNARLVERENISRNIHNSVGHTITAAIMTLDAADMLYDVKPDEARTKMNDANERMRGSLESIRRAVRVLDDECKDIAASDMKANMENVISEFVMDTSLKVGRLFDMLPDDVMIPQEHAAFLTGVLQEALTNGVKHGKANEFVVVLMGDTAHIKLDVSDNGTSDFDEANREVLIQNGFGIRKIISYVEKNGGKTSVVNQQGFRISVELPIVGADKASS